MLSVINGKRRKRLSEDEREGDGVYEGGRREISECERKGGGEHNDGEMVVGRERRVKCRMTEEWL